VLIRENTWLYSLVGLDIEVSSRDDCNPAIIVREMTKDVKISCGSEGLKEDI
jgi:hypothetical protein